MDDSLSVSHPPDAERRHLPAAREQYGSRLHARGHAPALPHPRPVGRPGEPIVGALSSSSPPPVQVAAANRPCSFFFFPPTPAVLASSRVRVKCVVMLGGEARQGGAAAV
jgi:hypothetical protein